MLVCFFPSSFMAFVFSGRNWTHDLLYAKHALYLWATPANFSLVFTKDKKLGEKNHFINKLKHLLGKVRELASPIAMLSLTFIFSYEEIVKKWLYGPGDWTSDSPIKNSCCLLFKGLSFYYQQPLRQLITVCNSISRGFDTVFSDSLSTCTHFIHSYKQHTHEKN